MTSEQVDRFCAELAHLKRAYFLNQSRDTAVTNTRLDTRSTKIYLDYSTHHYSMAVEAWYMDSSEEDQRKPHRLQPNEPVSLDELKELGVFYWKLNADIYETDPELEQIRKDQGYSYMDIICIHKDTLPNYEEKLKMFFEEHLHLDDEIRYILDGNAYFDVRGMEERWIRIAMKKGDLITLPAGIYHRFTLDETNYTKAMRLFVGEPVWKAYDRPADDFDARQKYLASLQQPGEKAV